MKDNQQNRRKYLQMMQLKLGINFQNRQRAYIVFKKQQTNNPIKEKNGQKI